MKITIVFLNNGSAVGRFEDGVYTYQHLYDDMILLATDYLTIISEGLDGSELIHWDGNEPEMWSDDGWDSCCIYEEDTDSENGYTVATELDPAWGGNVAEFLNAMRILRFYEKEKVW